MSAADAALVERLRDCGNGLLGTRSAQGDYGLFDDAADAITRLSADAARVGEMKAALKKALDAPMIDHSGQKRGVYDVIRHALERTTRDD